MKTETEIKRLARKIRFKPTASADERILTQAEAAWETSLRTKPKVYGLNLATYRIIIHNNLSKIAASLIVVAGLITVFLLGSGNSDMAFAKVIRPFLSAHTVAYKITINTGNLPPQTFDGMFMEPGRMRHTIPGEVIQIVDVQQGRIVMLMPEKKTATVLELESIPDIYNDKILFNRFLEIRKRIQETHQCNNEVVQFLGEREIEGKDAIGYLIRTPSPEMKVWADAKNLMPIRIEYAITTIKNELLSIIISDIAFNVELDEMFFSLEIPQDYTIQTVTMKDSESTESSELP